MADQELGEVRFEPLLRHQAVQMIARLKIVGI